MGQTDRFFRGKNNIYKDPVSSRNYYGIIKKCAKNSSDFEFQMEDESVIKISSKGRVEHLQVRRSNFFMSLCEKSLREGMNLNLYV